VEERAVSASLKDVEYLKRAVRRLVKSELSWADANGDRGQPSDYALIGAELEAARAQYARALGRLEGRK
jgi:hypothetical protein